MTEIAQTAGIGLKTHLYACGVTDHTQQYTPKLYTEYKVPGNFHTACLGIYRKYTRCMYTVFICAVLPGTRYVFNTVCLGYTENINALYCCCTYIWYVYVQHIIHETNETHKIMLDHTTCSNCCETDFQSPIHFSTSSRSTNTCRYNVRTKIPTYSSSIDQTMFPMPLTVLRGIKS